MWGKREDMIVHETDPYNAEAPRAALADRMLTPVASFYSRNHGPIPLIDPQAWRLTVGGLVARPLELSLADLKSRYPARTLTATLQCAGNRRAGLVQVRDIPGEDPWGPGATSTAESTGISLAPVLESAGVRPRARPTWRSRARTCRRSLIRPSPSVARSAWARRWRGRSCWPGR